MKKITILFLLLTTFSFQIKLKAACVWSPKITGFSVWDTCNYGGGSVGVKNAGCLYYKWSINGSTYVQGAGSAFASFSFPITANGTYTICVKVSDTCNKCDTTLCSSITVSCFKTCNWKNKISNFYIIDTCNGNGLRNTIHGYISNNSCFRYQWTVNGTIKGNSFGFSYNVAQNGVYNVCIKVTDTCNKCDTTYCATKTFGCFSTCNWNARNPVLTAKDSCKGSINFIDAGISFNGYYSGKYKCYWTLNGASVGNTSSVQKISVTSNGTYALCVKAVDSANHCDTTICTQVTVSCIKGCAWYQRSPYVYFSDTCRGNGLRNKINCAIYMGSGNCHKYQWSINGVNVNTNTGDPQWLVYDVKSNGTYTVCIKVTDTCNKCDTSFCATKVFTCFKNCQWSAKISNIYMSDTCRSYNQKNTINGNVFFNSGVNTSCFTYQWSINNVVRGTARNFAYTPTQNGTYYQCVKITDTCTGCDTIFCRYVNVSCINPPCGWKASVKLSVYNKCYNNRDTVYGYVSTNTYACLKYEWLLNGKAIPGNSNYLQTTINRNDSYVLCVKVKDTCNHCDTTLCSSFVVNCLWSAVCNNWEGRKPHFNVWDTCNTKGSRNSVNGSIQFDSSGCYTYVWYLNGKQVSKNNSFSAKITANGWYQVAVVVLDTCNMCDTMFDATIPITCFNSCIFKPAVPYFITYDSCKGNRSMLGGYIGYTNIPCLKYEWTVDSTVVSRGYYFNTSVYKNGNYRICLKLSDTCNNCDTTFCITRSVNCSGLGIASAFASEDIRIYPNPVLESLNIEYSGNGDRYEITDILGKTITVGELNAGKNTLPAGTWPGGVYLLKVFDGDKTRVYKVVVNR